MPSTVIQFFSYDAERRTLQVTYRSGKIYEYHDVPEQTFLQMKASFSKGTFLNTRIKGHFPYTKLAGSPKN